MTDLDGDGLPDVIRVVRADETRRVLMRKPGDVHFEVVSDSAASDDSLEEDASHWFTQATTYTCGPAVITMVLADLLDMRVSDEFEVWQRAIDLDAITNEGMRPGDIEVVIRSYGVPARTIYSDPLHLESLLEQGYEAIAMVDADEYFPNDGRGDKDVFRKWPHAVRVLAIDTVAGVVVISDSAWTHPMFSRLEIPLAHFVDAWEDLDWIAVVTEVTHTDVREHLAEIGAVLDHGVQRSPRARDTVPTIFLPFSARLVRLFEAMRRFAD